MRVLCFTEGFTPATRFRVLQYLPYLKARGVEVTVRYFRDANFPIGGFQDLRRYALAVRDLLKRGGEILAAPRYDVVCFQRELLPWNTDLLERLVARLNGRVVFDFDDAIYLPEAQPDRRAQKIQRILQRSRVATVANRTLQAFAAPWTETVLVPMAVDTDRLVPPNGSRDWRLTRIGWIGTSTNFVHLAEVREVLSALSARRDVEIVVMSNRAAIQELDGLPIRLERWSEAGEQALLQTLDIGLLPLDDSPWTRGKFPIKLLQYMAVGAVPVCSPVGVITEVIEDGVNGRLGADQADWLPALQQLIADRGVRARLGAAARQTVEQLYSIRAVLPMLLGAFERVAR